MLQEIFRLAAHAAHTKAAGFFYEPAAFSHVFLIYYLIHFNRIKIYKFWNKIKITLSRRACPTKLEGLHYKVDTY